MSLYLSSLDLNTAKASQRPFMKGLPGVDMHQPDARPLNHGEAERLVGTARCRVAVVSAWSAGPIQSRVLGATSRTITQLPWPLGRS